MSDYRDRIGSHSQFDDYRYWRFARRYPYPIHTGRKWTPDAIVVLACCVIGAALVLAIMLGYV